MDIPATAEVVVVGAGLAGSATALALAQSGRAVLLLTPDQEPRTGSTTSSALAQGGVAAAIGPDDHPARHAADTIAAGAGLTHPDVARRITAAAPDVVTRLCALGADFDAHADGSLRLGLEGAHGRHRIVHAHGDGSGAEMLRVVLAAASVHPRIRLCSGVSVTRLVTCGTHVDHPVTGVDVVDLRTHRTRRIATSAVVLATGGLGGLYSHTTNPVTSWGAGLALGLRAGARVRDLEMVQFHPTALDVPMLPREDVGLAHPASLAGTRMALVSEAVRGAGVALVLDDGTPLHNSLASRDVVARAVWSARRAGRGVFLDVPGSHLATTFADHFPTVNAACEAAGLRPSRDRLPIRPAAHYHMGGLAVNERGRTDVSGLWAVGEVASTGLHGANRLASNSLLEALVCADDVCADITAHPPVAGTPPLPQADEAGPLQGGPAWSDRLLLEEAAGLYREGASLSAAAQELRHGAEHDDARLVATLLLRAALDRTESRGAHQRLDHPEVGEAGHTYVSIDDLDRLHSPARPMPPTFSAALTDLTVRSAS